MQTPDGQRYSLGPVSVLRFAQSLARSSRDARIALDTFLKTGSAMLSVDEGRMWELLAPLRVRWAAGPFMPRDQHYPSLGDRDNAMATIFEDLAVTEQAVGTLNRLASQGRQDPKLVQHLVKLAQKIKSPNQSTNSTYYGLGAPDVFEVGDTEPAVHTVEASEETLAFDTYQKNMAAAEDILKKARETMATIKKLASQGRKFSSVRASADVAAVTSKVSAICASTQLTDEWVAGDLSKLAARINHLHGLFHPKA